MRRLFYSLTFALVLLLASLTSLASPGTPGTIPANTVWLPVVEYAERPKTCNYSIQWDVPDPYVVKLDEPVVVAFSWKYDGGGYNDPWWLLQASDKLLPGTWGRHYLFVNSAHAGLDSASETFVIQPEDGPNQPGEYRWSLRTDCVLQDITVPVPSPYVDLIVV